MNIKKDVVLMKDISSQTIKDVYDETKEFLNAKNTVFTETLSEFYLPYLAVYESPKIKRQIESSINAYLKNHNLRTKPRFSIKESGIIKKDDDITIQKVIFTLPTSTQYNVGVGESEITSRRKQFNILFNNKGITLERDYFENLYGYDSFVCDGNPLNNSFNIWISKNKNYFSVLRKNNKRLLTTLEGVTVTETPEGVKKVKTSKKYAGNIAFDLEFNTSQNDNLLLLNLKVTLLNKSQSKTYYIKIMGGKLQAYYFIDDIKVNLLENPAEIKRLYDELAPALDKASFTAESSYDIPILKKIMAYFFECASQNKTALSPNDLTIKEVSAIQRTVIENAKAIEGAIPVPYFRSSIGKIEYSFIQRKRNIPLVLTDTKY